MRKIVALSVFLAAGVSHAQVAPTQPPAQASERRVVISMDEDLIEGAVPAPPIHVIGSKPEPKYKNLIQMRKDFRREVLASGSRL